MRNRFLLSSLLTVILVGVTLDSWSAAKKEKDQPAMAPAFQIKNLEGERVSLEDLLGQGPVLISFWATWCKPCLKELPHLQEFYEEYQKRKLQVVAISEDSPRSLSKVKSFIAGHRYTFLVLLDDNYSTQRKFNFRGLPFTVLLDKEGHMVYKRMGYRPGDEQVLLEQILPLLEAEPQGEGEDEGESEDPEGEEVKEAEGEEAKEEVRGAETGLEEPAEE
jgi:cytochrome c biogenesis protein CcmG/thiol:disulfide interchange protein DsbE